VLGRLFVEAEQLVVRGQRFDRLLGARLVAGLRQRERPLRDNPWSPRW